MVPDELVTLTSWDARDFLIFLVIVGWKGKDAVKDGVVAFSIHLFCRGSIPGGFHIFRIVWIIIPACLIKQSNGALSRVYVHIYQG